MNAMPNIKRSTPQVFVIALKIFPLRYLTVLLPKSAKTIGTIFSPTVKAAMTIKVERMALFKESVPSIIGAETTVKRYPQIAMCGIHGFIPKRKAKSATPFDLALKNFILEPMSKNIIIPAIETIEPPMMRKTNAYSLTKSKAIRPIITINRVKAKKTAARKHKKTNIPPINFFGSFSVEIKYEMSMGVQDARQMPMLLISPNIKEKLIVSHINPPHLNLILGTVLSMGTHLT